MNHKQRFTCIEAVYIVMVRNDKILLLRRCNTGYCDGMYGLPAGHVEAGESVRQAMIREAREEIGIAFPTEQLTLAHTRSRNAPDGHRVDHFFVAREWDSEPQNLEPEKCDDLSWFALDALPDSTIPYVREVIELIQQGEMYSEEGWV